MTENLLQLIWKFKLFNSFKFKDYKGNEIEILDFGEWNHNAGADFLMAKIRYEGIILVGNIEIHVKSSDYIQHQHLKNKAYDNIILHAVYEYDKEIEILEKKNVPTLILKPYIDEDIISKNALLSMSGKFIPCENIWENVLEISFLEELLLNKLEQKSQELSQELLKYKNDYEAVLFHRLAYAFGLKINAEIFLQIAQSIDFSIIKKIRQNRIQLEALFFGISGWLDEVLDEKMEIWKREYHFLTTKFQLADVNMSPKFLRLRPPNFPTIRLSQLSGLYHRYPNLFSMIMEVKNVKEIKEILKDISASEYWNNHFVFGKVTKSQRKILSKSFIDLLIINAILPIRYHYFKNINREKNLEVLDFYRDLPAENNSILEKWKQLGVEIRNSLESQGLLFLYKNFCNCKKCLNCRLGHQLLKNNAK